MDTNYITIKEVAARASLSIRTLRSFIKQPNNPLPCFKVGGKLLFSWQEVAKWVEQSRVKAIDTKAIVQSITTKLKERSKNEKGKN
jgi:excisionase family DNA binding protein